MKVPASLRAPLLRWARRTSKAIGGGIAASGAALGATLVSSGGDVSRGDVLVAVGMGLTVGFGGTYLAPKNRDH